MTPIIIPARAKDAGNERNNREIIERKEEAVQYIYKEREKKYMYDSKSNSEESWFSEGLAVKI